MRSTRLLATHLDLPTLVMSVQSAILPRHDPSAVRKECSLRQCGCIRWGARSDCRFIWASFRVEQDEHGFDRDSDAMLWLFYELVCLTLTTEMFRAFTKIRRRSKTLHQAARVVRTLRERVSSIHSQLILTSSFTLSVCYFWEAAYLGIKTLLLWGKLRGWQSGFIHAMKQPVWLPTLGNTPSADRCWSLLG